MIPPVLPTLIMNAEPMLRCWWPLRFIRYQQMTVGPAPKAPMQTRQMPPYCAENCPCVVINRERPMMMRAPGSNTYGNRYLDRSDRYARRRHITSAAAKGGTECNWTSTVE